MQCGGEWANGTDSDGDQRLGGAKNRCSGAHLPGLLAYQLYPVTNAVSEGFNSKVKALKAAARGFRNAANYRIRILFFAASWTSATSVSARTTGCSTTKFHEVPNGRVIDLVETRTKDAALQLPGRLPEGSTGGTGSIQAVAMDMWPVASSSMPDGNRVLGNQFAVSVQL